MSPFNLFSQGGFLVKVQDRSLTISLVTKDMSENWPAKSCQNESSVHVQKLKNGLVPTSTHFQENFLPGRVSFKYHKMF